METRRFEFKKLDIKPEGTWLQRTIRSRHIQKTALFILLGAVAGFAIFYFSEGKNMEIISFESIIKSTLIGGFFGFWITNSPCARGRC